MLARAVVLPVTMKLLSDSNWTSHGDCIGCRKSRTSPRA
jgi:hypothetical protein